MIVPRGLANKTVVEAVAEYDPGVLDLPAEEQEIVVYFPPLWIMSPRIRVYRAQDIIRFRGHLNKFEPAEFDPRDMVATVTITPTEESK